MHIATGGGPNADHDVKTVAVYDSTSGRVVHTHHVVTLAGGTPTDDDQIRARALQFAQDLLAGPRGKGVGTLETIFVDARSLIPGVTYTVDTKHRTLVQGQPFTTRGKA
jgi:hypothetical protein